MAHIKAGGSTKNGRDSQAKRLGVKLFAGETVRAGGIIIRQRGTVYELGDNVDFGSDHTIFALKGGKVSFRQKRVTKYDGRVFRKTFVNVN